MSALMVACTFKESWLGASGGPGVSPPPLHLILFSVSGDYHSASAAGPAWVSAEERGSSGSPWRCEDSMLERLLAFCCLFVFNCQLYGKWAALGGSRGVQRGRGARLSPGAEGRTRCAFTPGKTPPLRLRWGELGRDPSSAFPCKHEPCSRSSKWL